MSLQNWDPTIKYVLGFMTTLKQGWRSERFLWCFQRPPNIVCSGIFDPTLVSKQHKMFKQTTIHKQVVFICHGKWKIIAWIKNSCKQGHNWLRFVFKLAFFWTRNSFLCLSSWIVKSHNKERSLILYGDTFSTI